MYETGEDMDVTAAEFVTIFVVSFFFGLTFRLLYGRMNGNIRRPTKVRRPIENVRYISPKVNKPATDAHRRAQNDSEQGVAGR